MQAADDVTRPLGDDEQLVGIGVDRLEGFRVGAIQGARRRLAPGAQRVVGQQVDDGAEVAALRPPDGDLGRTHPARRALISGITSETIFSKASFCDSSVG